MTSLKSYISSEYQKAANALRSKSAPTTILVRVESTEDVSFWHGILEPFQKAAGILFDIKPYSQESLTTGKGALAQNFSNVGSHMIICLDSDYDYILPEHSDVARKINQNSCIFQTYAYAIENLKCYAESLAGVCVRATHNTSPTINFPLLLEKYSETIYELFIWNVYFSSISDTKSFTIENFREETKTPQNPQIEDNGQSALNSINIRVQIKLQELRDKFPTHAQEIAPLSEKLEEFGVRKNNCYLFINGHGLHEDFILNFLNKIHTDLLYKQFLLIDNCHDESIKEIESLPEPERVKREEGLKKQRKDQKSNYNKIKKDMKTVLSINHNFQDCFLHKKMEKDIEIFLSSHHSQ